MAASEPEPPASSIPQATQNGHADTAVNSLAHTSIPTSPQASPLQHYNYIPTPTRFQFPFPDVLDDLFRSFDDRFIRFAQYRTSGPVHFCAMALTVFTAIETSLFVPPFLLALGYDAAGGLSASVLLTLGIVSQMPKKFIFRARPWMVGRALAIRRDKTSSFPSRAVACAVVFSWLLVRSLELEGAFSPPLPAVYLWLVILVIASCAAAARVNVGAHYPSDTVLGFLLGCLVIAVGTRFETAWQRVGCSARMPYVNEVTSDLVSPGTKWSFHNFVIVTAAAIAMTLVSIQGFWVKCSYVYGLLMGSVAFRASFLCVPRDNGHRGVAVSRLMRQSLTNHIMIAGVFSSLLLFGMATRTRKGIVRVFVFLIIYFGTFVGITYWRVG